MARNQVFFGERQVAFQNVQIRAAHSTGQHLNQDVSHLRLRTRYVLHFKEGSGRCGLASDNGSFHLRSCFLRATS